MKVLFISVILSFGLQQLFCQNSSLNKDTAMVNKVIKSNSEWKDILTPLQYHITREKGTELAFTGEYFDLFEKGSYLCIGCGTKLFDSETKFNSGCGWPSFNDVLSAEKVILRKDTSHGMIRTEVVCSVCEAHLGHVFNDGPPPTHLRYCINSASLKFVPEEK